MHESLPLCGDAESTLTQNPEEWLRTPCMMSLLDREGPGAAAAAIAAQSVVEESGKTEETSKLNFG